MAAQPEKLSSRREALESLTLSDSGPQTSCGRPQAEAISVASVWQMESPDAANALLSGESEGYVYRRDGHPNERSLRRKLAELHGASDAHLTAQGMSAMTAIALTNLRPGASVWLANELYGKTSKLFAQTLSPWGVQVEFWDPTNVREIQRLANSTATLVVIETVSNPRLRIPDIESIAAATHRCGGRLVVDNTFATHLLCRPLEWGADLVVESLSKLVNGHSDAMLGFVCAADDAVMNLLGESLSTLGLASSPLDCYLTHRGLLSLAVRLERCCSNAIMLAKCLEGNQHVRSVDYPGLENSPFHSVAARQMHGGFGWMVTFQIEPDRMRVRKLFEALRPEISFVPSLGDACTTVSHPVTTSHRGQTPEQLAGLGIDEGTVRISCGLEPTSHLVAKFESALQRAHR